MESELLQTQFKCNKKAMFTMLQSLAFATKNLVVYNYSDKERQSVTTIY